MFKNTKLKNNNIWFSKEKVRHHTTFFGTTGKGKTTNWDEIIKQENIKIITKKLKDF